MFLRVASCHDFQESFRNKVTKGKTSMEIENSRPNSLHNIRFVQHKAQQLKIEISKRSRLHHGSCCGIGGINDGSQIPEKKKLKLKEQRFPLFNSGGVAEKALFLCNDPLSKLQSWV